MEKSESMLEDSCVLIDPLKSQQRGDLICDMCKLTEDLLLNKGPLIPMAYDVEGYYLCRGCIKLYVNRQMKTEVKGQCIKYSVSNLIAPGSKCEFPRNFIVDGKTVDLITIPRINTTIYIILERTNYDRPLGHVEGLVIKLNELTTYSIGGGAQANVTIPEHGLNPVHCSITFSENKFLVSDNNVPTATYIKPYNTPVLDETNSSLHLKMHDHLLTFHWKKSVHQTASDFVQLDNEFQSPVYARRENLVCESNILAGDNSQISQIAQKADAAIYDHKGQVNKIPRFPSKMIQITTSTVNPDSQATHEGIISSPEQKPDVLKQSNLHK